MRRIILWVAGGLLAAAASALAWGEVVASFPAPTNSVDGVEWYDGRLYVVAGLGRYCRIWQLEPNTGSVFSSYQVPNFFAKGFTAGEVGGRRYGWLAVSSSSWNIIYQLELGTGSAVQSFPVPGPFAHGVAFGDEKTLYHTDYQAKMLYVMQPTTGSIVESHRLPYQPGGVDYDPEGYLWIIDFYRGNVCRCTLNGARLASFCPVKSTVISGVSRYGDYVWVTANYPLYMVFKCYVGDIGLAPASLGKVKALFR